MARRSIRSRTSGLAVFSVALLAGCGTSLVDRETSIRLQPTPEIDTLYQRPDDIANTWTVMDDENWRMFVQDLGRAFYTDRPSRLTREPVPHP
jgi:hypothetical protein